MATDLSTLEKAGIVLQKGGLGAGVFLLAVAVLYTMLVGTDDRYKGADAARDAQRQALVDAQQSARIKALEDWRIKHLAGGPHREASAELAALQAVLEALKDRVKRLEDK